MYRWAVMSEGGVEEGVQHTAIWDFSVQRQSGSMYTSRKAVYQPWSSESSYRWRRRLKKKHNFGDQSWERCHFFLYWCVKMSFSTGREHVQTHYGLLIRTKENANTDPKQRWPTWHISVDKVLCAAKITQEKKKSIKQIIVLIYWTKTFRHWGVLCSSQGLSTVWLKGAIYPLDMKSQIQLVEERKNITLTLCPIKLKSDVWMNVGQLPKSQKIHKRLVD